MDLSSFPLKFFLKKQLVRLFRYFCPSRAGSFFCWNPDKSIAFKQKSPKFLFCSGGQVIVEALLSFLALLVFLYLLQSLYERSDSSIQKARLSFKPYFKKQEIAEKKTTVGIRNKMT